MQPIRILVISAAALTTVACGAGYEFTDESIEPIDDAELADQAEGAAESIDEALGQATVDPSAQGRYAVSSATYGADTVRQNVDGVLSEHLGQVYYPTDMRRGPFPLVLFLHGNHAGCESPTGAQVTDDWPCEAPNTPVPSFRGYDYLARALASHGIIAASISANGINAAGSGITEPREALIARHMEQFDQYDASGASAPNPFPGVAAFQGKVDMNRVALVGHSRGGAAVTSFTAKGGTAAGTIRAVLAIAPSSAAVVSQIPVALLHGYCDGDIARLPGLRLLDDARSPSLADETEKYTFVVPGANHNFFNQIWSPGNYPTPPAHVSDDALTANGNHRGDPFCDPTLRGNGRLSEGQQRDVAKSYALAFLRRHLLGQTEFDSILKGDASPRPEKVTRSVRVGYLPGKSNRQDINSADPLLFELDRNDIAGIVRFDDFTSATSCSGRQGCLRQDRAGHTYPRLKLTWDDWGAVFANEVTSGFGNASRFGYVQFRVGTDHTDARNTSSRDFSVVLRDNRGRSASVSASSYSNAFDLPPGEGDTRVSVMATVRIPTSAFRGIDTNNITSVQFVFDRKDTGTLFVSDLAFAR
jgi:predicted dienelactone hydrolase